jgi:DNA/RNA-binding domain of Phe-tRNA-synthetase-like protein
MSIFTYSIDKQVFDFFPDFIRGVLVAQVVQNTASPPELTAILRREEGKLRDDFKGQDIAVIPQISTWREAFRCMGVKPGDYRSSIESMLRRVVNGHQLPSINALVDIGNIISLRYLIPAGGHALDHVEAEISLRPATGKEVFTPMGSDKVEHPDPGEIVFVEGDTVLTRRWVWRQSNYTLTQLNTHFIEFNLDGLPPVEEIEIRKAGEDLADMVERFCGGETKMFVLSIQKQRIEIST